MSTTPTGNLAKLRGAGFSFFLCLLIALNLIGLIDVELKLSSCLSYNFVMNKRAKKRLKESIKKQIAERSPEDKGQGSSSPIKKLPESRGFTPRPAKKKA